MKFETTLDCGNSGTVDIGKKGVTTDNPDDPDFLGLPVIYDVDFIPHGMDPIPSNAVYKVESLQAVFHGDTMDRSGTFKVIPEPGALGLLVLGGLVASRRRRGT